MIWGKNPLFSETSICILKHPFSGKMAVTFREGLHYVSFWMTFWWIFSIVGPWFRIHCKCHGCGIFMVSWEIICRYFWEQDCEIKKFQMWNVYAWPQAVNLQASNIHRFSEVSHCRRAAGTGECGWSHGKNPGFLRMEICLKQQE